MPNKIKNKNWVIPKNNKDWEAHKFYVNFVILFHYEYNRWPSEQEYLDEIVTFITSKGIRRTEKTNVKHQLYSPIFYGLLEYEKKDNDHLVKATKIGKKIISDKANTNRDCNTFEMAYFNASLGSGSQGNKNFYKIYPLKELINNLIIKSKISFKELNGKFNYSKPGTNIDNLDWSKLNSPQWEYALKWMKEAKLIRANGSLSNVSPNSKGYLETSFIEPTKKLVRFVNLVKNNKWNNQKNEIKDLEKNKYNIDKKVRNPLYQNAFRGMLLERDRNCIACGISNPLVLQASHILSFELCSKHQAFDPDNGILLCSMHDMLFDSGLATIKNDQFILSNSIAKEDKSIIFKVEFKNIFLSKKQKIYMNLHNEYEFEKFKELVKKKREKFKKQNREK